MACQDFPRSARPASPALSLRFLGKLPRLFALQRQRRQLRQLDAHLLHDLGISRAEAEREAQKPFWDAPDWWK